MPVAQLKVLDFGLAKLLDPTAPQLDGETRTLEPLTGTGVLMGTLGYMSPEQVRGDTVDQRSDIFSLGCVLYQMVAGKPPFARARIPKEWPRSSGMIRRRSRLRPAGSAGARTIDPPLSCGRSGSALSIRGRSWLALKALVTAPLTVHPRPPAISRGGSLSPGRVLPRSAPLRSELTCASGEAARSHRWPYCRSRMPPAIPPTIIYPRESPQASSIGCRKPTSGSPLFPLRPGSRRRLPILSPRPSN